MNNLSNMPTVGLVVMIVIGLLFVLSLLLLFHVYLRYKLLAGKAKGDPEKVRGFRAAVLEEYTNAYRKYGQDTNTPPSSPTPWGPSSRGCCSASAF